MNLPDPVNLWAAIAAAVAGYAVGMRAHMLRPRETAWTAAPVVVCVALTILALGLFMTAVTLFSGARATEREAMVYTLLAGVSLVMLWNLHRNGKAAAVKQEEIRREVSLVMELSGAPARMPGERSS